jgi:hypothetical protein
LLLAHVYTTLAQRDGNVRRHLRLRTRRRCEEGFWALGGGGGGDAPEAREAARGQRRQRGDQQRKIPDFGKIPKCWVNDIDYSLIYTPLAKTQCSCSHCGGWSCCLGSRISAFCFLRQNCERRLDTCIPQGQRKGPINMRCPLVRQDTQQKFSRDGVVI